MKGMHSGATLLWPMVFSALLAVVFFLFADQFSEIFLKTHLYGPFIRVMALGIVSSKWLELTSQLCNITDQFEVLSVTRVANVVGTQLAALPLYFVFGMHGYLFAQVVFSILTGLILFYCMREYLFIKSGVGSLRKLLPYSMPFYGDQIVRYFAGQGDQLIVNITLMPQQIATYFVARRFMDYLNLLVDELLNPLVPKIAAIRDDPPKILSAFMQSFRYVVFVLTPCVVGVAVLSYPLLNLYGGGKYLSGMATLSLLAFASLAYAGRSLFGVFAYLIGQPADRFKQGVVNAVLTLTLGVILVRVGNITGLALARLLALGGTAIFCWWQLRRLVGGRISIDKAAIREVAWPAFVMGAIIVTLQILYYRLELVPLYAFLGGSVFLLLFLRNINAQDYGLLVSLVPGRYKPWLASMMHSDGRMRLWLLGTHIKNSGEDLKR